MMVSQMGFSKKLGQVAWSSQGGNSFLGAQMAQPADCSGETQDAIDAEVKVRAYGRGGGCAGSGGGTRGGTGGGTGAGIAKGWLALGAGVIGTGQGGLSSSQARAGWGGMWYWQAAPLRQGVGQFAGV